MIRTLVHGSGRMAGSVLANMPAFPDFELLGVVSRSEPEGESVPAWFRSLDDIADPVDLLIDFTLPGGTTLAAQWCASHDVALLSGTTGLSEEDFTAMKDAGLHVPVLWAPNLSQGIALISELVRQAAASLGSGARIAITDVHHVHKQDAPSGTALALCQSVLEGLPGDGVEPEISSIREGEVIGEHSVEFLLPEEKVQIRHQATTRDVFARGALKAGHWLVGQKPGYYSARDWLGLN